MICSKNLEKSVCKSSMLLGLDSISLVGGPALSTLSTYLLEVKLSSSSGIRVCAERRKNATTQDSYIHFVPSSPVHRDSKLYMKNGW